MAKQNLVVAMFDNEAAADDAVAKLKAWDKVSKEVKLGSIGVMVKDDKGKVKTQKLGTRAWGRGAGIGVVLGLIAAVPTGGLSLLGGAAWGAVGGGIIGAFFHNGLGLSKDDLAELAKHLDGGKAAVGVLAPEDEAKAVEAKLTELGGKTKRTEVSDETLQQAATVAEAAPEVAPAAEAPAAEEKK